ncbi:hypothetical protein [Nostoc sp.]
MGTDAINRVCTGIGKYPNPMPHAQSPMPNPQLPFFFLAFT